MSKQRQFFVRTPNGQLRTVNAYDTRDAVLQVADKYKLTGVTLEAKERGVGDWDTYDIR